MQKNTDVPCQIKGSSSAQHQQALQITQQVLSGSLKGIRNTLPPVMRLPQPEQKKNAIQQQPQSIMSPPESSCCARIKPILIITLLVPLHFLTAQIFFPILILLIAPIFSSIAFVFYSLVVGMREMIENQSCLKIALLNIFISLYYVATCFYKNCLAFFMDRYCRNIVTLENLFPISYSIVYRKVIN